MAKTANDESTESTILI